MSLLCSAFYLWLLQDNDQSFEKKIEFEKREKILECVLDYKPRLLLELIELPRKKQIEISSF